MLNSRIFDINVPRKLLQSLTYAVLQNYRESSRFCFRNFSHPQAWDLSGHFCRARIEEELAGIAALFPSVSLAMHRYENNTGFYNELTCGAVKITQSRIINPHTVPRHAKFRSTLAANGQCSLFAENQSSTYEQSLYAILTHVVDINSEKRSWPAVVKIQFPNSNCTSYVDEGIDLLARFPELASEYIPGAPALARLRRRRLRAQEGA